MAPQSWPGEGSYRGDRLVAARPEMSPEDELDELLSAGAVDVPERGVRAAVLAGLVDDPRFRIASMDKASIDRAEWAATQLRKARRLFAAKEAVVEARQQALDRYQSAAAAEVSAAELFFGGLLTSWLRREREADKRVTSIDLPGGTRVKSTKGRVTARVEDQAAFEAWATANGMGDLVRPPKPAHPEVEKAKVTKAFDTNLERDESLDEVEGLFRAEGGETVPGLVAHRAPASFGVVTPGFEG